MYRVVIVLHSGNIISNQFPFFTQLFYIRVTIIYYFLHSCNNLKHEEIFITFVIEVYYYCHRIVSYKSLVIIHTCVTKFCISREFYFSLIKLSTKYITIF